MIETRLIFRADVAANRFEKLRTLNVCRTLTLSLDRQTRCGASKRLISSQCLTSAKLTRLLDSRFDGEPSRRNAQPVRALPQQLPCFQHGQTLQPVQTPDQQVQ
jgi:hypothetical protein